MKEPRITTGKVNDNDNDVTSGLWLSQTGPLGPSKIKQPTQPMPPNMPTPPLPAENLTQEGKLHYHTDEQGLLVRCYHSCARRARSFGFFSFSLGVTLSFPLEHYLYEHVWPFYLVTQFLKL